MASYNDVLTLIQTLLQTNSDITATEHRQVEEAILDFARDQWLPGDIKEIDCTDAYIAANFDANGIGINERAGWAICNGYNGWTRNRTGRVSVAYGNTSPLTTPGDGITVYTSVGATLSAPVIGGSKDAVVVSHTHKIAKTTGNFSSTGGLAPVSFGTGFTVDSESTGVSGTNKNMQPYIVTLFIQKL